MERNILGLSSIVQKKEQRNWLVRKELGRRGEKMPFGKKGNISKGRPDGRKNNKVTKTGADGIGKKTRFTKDNNPSKKYTPNPAALGIGEETRFKKGHVPRNKLLRTILKERGFTREVINEIYADILTANPKLIQEMKINDEISMLELIGISGVEAAMRTADFGRLDFLLGSIFGKEVQRTETINYNMNAALDPKTSEEDAQIVQRVFERANGADGKKH